MHFFHAVPPQPNTSITQRSYGRLDVNVTLTWNIHADRIDTYHIATSEGHVMSINQNYRTVNIVNIPYDTNITVEITAVVCGVHSESGLFDFFIGECNINFHNLLGNNV